MSKKYKYQIAVSFSSEEREYVEEVVSHLNEKDINVFYDKFYEVEMMGNNIRDFLVKVYTEEVEFFSIIFISKSYGQSDWTDIERQAIQSLAIGTEERTKKEEFVMYARFDDTQIEGVLSSTYIKDLRDDISPQNFSNLIEKKIEYLKEEKKAYKRLAITRKTNILEGYKSPKDWFLNWNKNINEPKLPDYDRLMNDTFIETEVYKKVLNSFLDGKRRVGITGMLGMGGVGKTYTAMKIADELMREYQWKIVWISLLQQSSDEVLNQLAEEFGFYFVANLKAEEKVLAIRELYNLANQRFPKLLVILDNAEGFKGLEVLVDIALSKTNILVTSRERNYAMIPYIQLEPFEDDKAIEYCKKILNYFSIDIKPEMGDEDDLKRISLNVQGHPLALKLIMSKFIENIEKYEVVPNRFNLLWGELNRVGILELETNSFDKSSIKKNIRTSFEWLYVDLPNQNESFKQNAYYLLPIVAVLGTDKVSLQYIQDGIRYLVDNNQNYDWIDVFQHFDDLNNLRASLNYLKRISLVSERINGIYSVHPLIREFAISYMEKNDIYAEIEDIDDYSNYIDSYKETLFQGIDISDIKDINKLANFNNDSKLNDIYQLFIYSRIKMIPVSSNKQKKFASLLLKSFSLDVSEKQKVIDATTDGLSTFQCEELIRVWEEEEEKFSELAKNNPDDISKLLHRTYLNNLELLANNISKENLFSKKDVNVIKAPSSKQVYSMALEVVGKELYSDTLLDLLPRLKTHKQLMQLSIKRIKSEFGNLYFKPTSWNYLGKALEISLKITKDLGLYDEYHWVAFKLGELKDRREFENGKEILEEAIESFIQKNASAKFGKININTICDWAIIENKYEVIWSSLYVRSYLEDNKFNKNDFPHMMQTLRLLYSFNDSYNRMKIFEKYSYFMTEDFFETFQISLSAKNQEHISNIILDLSVWIKLKIRESESKEFIPQVDALVNLAINNEKYQVSQEHYIWYELSKYTELFKFGLIEKKALDMNIARLKNMAKENGIRGFRLEALYHQALIEKYIENLEYEMALHYIDKAIELNSILNNNEDIIMLKFFKILCTLFENNIDINNLQIELIHIKNEAKEQYFYELISLYYLIDMIILNKINQHQESQVSYKKSFELYNKYLSYIPPYTRNIFKEYQSWNSIEIDSHSIENWTPWRINPKHLPKRVISKIDNREMILVESGIQIDKNGNEIWIYPFYIDIEPLKIESIENLNISPNLLVNELDSSIVSVSSNYASIFAKKLNKKIPSKTELFIAYRQIQENIKPEQWNSMDNTLNKMYSRIEYVIKNGKPKKREVKFDNIFNSPMLQEKEDIPFSSIAEFYQAKWLDKNKLLKEKYIEVIIEPFQNLPISQKEQEELAILLVGSLSLNKQDKLRVINGAMDGLSICQCEELIEVWREEKEKFVKLSNEHPEDVQKLLAKAYYELFDLLDIFVVTKVDNYYDWYTYTCVPYTDKWLERDGAVEENISDNYIGLSEKPKNILPILRYIKPIFTKVDLDDLIPINS